MSLLMPLLLGFGPSGSSTPPVGATLSVVDQYDGTGATATIAGTSGASNAVRVYTLRGVLVDTFTRSGDGTLDLVLAPGVYTAELVSDDFAAAPIVYFRATGLPTAARGSPSVAEEALKTTLANCSEFQALVGAVDESESRLRIHMHALPPPVDGEAYAEGEEASYRPFAMIFTMPFGGGHHWQRIATETWRDGGRIMILLETTPPQSLAASDAALQRYWLNFVGRLEKADPDESGTVGLIDLAHTSPDADHQYLAIDKVSLEASYRCFDDDEESQGDHITAELIISWGGH